MEAIEQKVSNLTLTGYLLCYQSERDKALGLSYPGTQTKLLSWYHQELQKQQLNEAFRFGVLQQARRRMADIIQEAESSPIERQRELLKSALTLQEFVDKVTNG